MYLAAKMAPDRPIASLRLPGYHVRPFIMTSRDLTPQQASDLHQEIHRIAMYINRLANRMAELQFAPDDRLFQHVKNAERSLAVLSKETYAVRTQLHPRASKRSMGG